MVFDGGSLGATGNRRIGMGLFTLLAALFASALLSGPVWSQTPTLKSPRPMKLLPTTIIQLRWERTFFPFSIQDTEEITAEGCEEAGGGGAAPIT